MDVIRLTVAEIRAKAVELRESFGDDARARALEWAAMRMEQAARAQENEPLTLGEAAARSGYNPTRFAVYIAKGACPRRNGGGGCSSGLAISRSASHALTLPTFRVTIRSPMLERWP
ncbi:MAG: hypothetical protein M3081_03555 [Gemmatimonadota bacterium]|nr:hypothetical protein [Gemmatimonadota bacterium]